MRPICALGICLLTACGSPAEDLILPTAGKADSTLDLLGQGTHRLVVMSRSRIRDRESGKEHTLTTRITALAGLDPGESSIWIDPCRVELPEVGAYQAVLPDETVRRAWPVAAPAWDDDETGLTTDLMAFTLGLSLDDPLNDPIPDDNEDPAFIDQDGDGAPGVSINVMLFSIHVAIRLTLAIDKSVVSTVEPGVIVGTALVHLEQRVLGDSIPFFDAAEAAANAKNKNEILQTTHSFRLEPTDAITCLEL